MTISTTYEPVQYTGNSVTTAFTFSYPFFASTDLLVYLDGVLQATGYTVSGGAGSSGTVTFSVAPTTGVIITIELSLPYTQLDNYVENQAFPADTLEKGLDRAALRDQQLANSIERSLVFPATLSGSLVGELPQPVDNKTLVWDGTTGLVKNGPDAIDVSTAVADAEAAQAAAEAAQAAAELAQAGAETAEDNAVAAAGSASIGNLFLLTTGTIATDDYIAFSDTSASNVGKKTTLANVDAGFFGSGSATDNYVLTADGAGGAAWEAASGALPDQTGNSGRYLSTNGTIPIWAPVSVTTGMVPIKTTTVSSPVSSVDFVNGTSGVVLDSTYKAYMIVISSLVPSTDGVDLWVRTSTNAGSSYDSGASDYRHGVTSIEAQDTPTTLLAGDSADAQIKITNSRQCGSDTGETFNSIIQLYNPSGTKYAIFGWKASYHASNGVLVAAEGAGSRLSAADVDAIRFLMSSGNIASGTFTLYGLKDA